MKSNGIAVATKVGGHSNRGGGLGDPAPCFSGDKGLIGETNDHGTRFQALGLADTREHRTTLPIGPPVVMDDDNVAMRQHGGRNFGGASHHDDRRKARL